MTCFTPTCCVCNVRIRRQCVNHDVCCNDVCRVIWSALTHVPCFPPQSVDGLGWPSEVSA